MQKIQKKLLIVGIALGCLSLRGSDSAETVSEGSVCKPNFEKQKLGTEGLGHREVRAVTNESKPIELKEFTLPSRDQSSRAAKAARWIKHGALGVGMLGVLGILADTCGVTDSLPKIVQDTDWKTVALASGLVHVIITASQNENEVCRLSGSQVNLVLECMALRKQLLVLYQENSQNMQNVLSLLDTAEKDLGDHNTAFHNHAGRILKLEDYVKQRQDDYEKSGEELIEQIAAKGMQEIRSRVGTPKLVIESASSTSTVPVIDPHSITSGNGQDGQGDEE